MSLSAYLWRDLLEVRHSRVGSSTAAVFVLLAGGFVAVFGVTGSITPVYAVLFFASPFLFPAVGLLTTALSLARHRESGSIRVLLTVPGRRRTAVVATFLSRAVVVTAGFLLIAAAVAGIELIGSVNRQFGLGLVSLSWLLTLSGVGVGTLISTIATSQRQALFAAVAYYVIVVVWWCVFFPQSPDRVVQLLVGEALGPATTQPLMMVSPANAYLVLFQLLGSDGGFVATIGSLFGTPIPDPLPGLAVLVCWTTVPVVVAAGWLERSEVY
ncbi:ABC transporter permease subunit [Halobaculum sp. MBLA0143]|uniref:ABC transporter permease subunit n=1 Tax=Halobaculum sp. MBLA0143 TaxID=3079933 RepID=UPI003525FC8B